MTFNQAETEDKIRTIVAEQMGIEKEDAKNTANWIKMLGCEDSDVEAIMKSIEAEFKIEIDEIEAANIRTIAAAVQYIKVQAINAAE